ncbi:uncharacterized protein LOC100275511 [Zea mays]|jgi:hypothetical protein|uniref:HMA domain-containing protein n=1 Tax=Zea mays TaxID=4577 RepID=A0A1D6HPN5_MAIZE|nr:uncharacterized protein LOC100275511 [Zea mays]AQK76236.1 hypothetical protein ZEAMMB73_Zm00001d018491 [Zea mays]|eukprot:NP_001143043.2 uncharacterized protein LOC100275511 [Zea mays]
MGKKSGRSGADAPKATAFVLKVAMHCRCDGCVPKIRAAVNKLTLRCEGIQSLDQSALDTKGELALVATADPERLRRRLREATGKSVDIVFPKPAAANGGSSGREEANAAVQAQAQAQAQALLLAAGLQQQQQHGRPWYALQQGGYGPPPEPYVASYPATAWGAYPHNGLDDAYGGGWFGY